MNNCELIENFTKNIIFEAGAGTGKTSILASKIIIYMLGESISKLDKTRADNQLEITKVMSSFAAMTFTLKAAYELKERVRKILLLLSNNFHDEPLNKGLKCSIIDIKKSLFECYNLDEKEIINRAILAYEISDKLCITTMHGFCNDILKSYGTYINLSPEFKIDENLSVYKNIYHRRWANYLQEKLNRGNTSESNWLTILDVTEDFDMLKNLIFKLANSMIPISEFNKLHKEITDKDVEVISENKDGTKIIQNNLFYLNLLGEIIPFMSELRQKWKRDGIISFNHILLLTQELLSSERIVCEKLQEKYKLFFVDESQDTDPIQYAIIEKILNSKIRNGSLFIVGDPKQSIYRFRGADLKSYEIIKNEMMDSGSVTHQLSNNYRSNRIVINHVNNLFSQLPLFDDSSSCKYHNLIADKDSSLVDDEYPVEIWVAGNNQRDAGPNLSYLTDNLNILSKSEQIRISSNDARQIEAQHIAKWICESVGTKKIKTDGDNYIKYGDIVLLLRALSNVDIYTSALTKYNIPYVVSGDKKFYQCEEVICILNLLRTLINPTDSISLIGFLRSPVVGIPDRGIMKLKEYNIFESSKITDERLLQGEEWERQCYTILSIISKFRQSYLSYPLDEWSDDLLKKIPIIPVFASIDDGTDNGTQRAINIIKVLDEFKNFNIGNEEGIQDWIESKTATIEDESEEEGKIWEEDTNVVRIMSIHKAKGLEFPIVFFPDNHRKNKKPITKPYDYIYSYTEGISIRINDKNKNKIVTKSYENMKKNEELNEHFENRRLSYVAQTRAKEKLIILGGFTLLTFGSSHIREILVSRGAITEQIVKKKKEIKIIEGNGIKIISGFNDDTEISPRRARRNDNSSFLSSETARLLPDQSYVNIWNERIENFNKMMKIKQVITPSYLIKESEINYEVYGNKNEFALTLGNLCHRVLEKIKYENYENELESLLNQEAELIDADTNSIEKAKSILQNYSRSSIYDEIKNSKIIGREIPFFFPISESGWDIMGYVSSDSVVNGFIDIVYETGNKIVVADYKTGVFKESKTDRYKPQIIIYKSAIKSALNLSYEPEFKLIFIESAIVVCY